MAVKISLSYHSWRSLLLPLFITHQPRMMEAICWSITSIVVLDLSSARSKCDYESNLITKLRDQAVDVGDIWVYSGSLTMVPPINRHERRTSGEIAGLFFIPVGHTRLCPEIPRSQHLDSHPCPFKYSEKTQILMFMEEILMLMLISEIKYSLQQ